jgi:16S rRNA (cytosine967-C5)-methyltransferase
MSMKPGVAVRVRAARVVADVVGHGASLTRALPQACDGITDDRDAALLKALALGTVRAWFRLARITRLCLDRPLTRGRLELEAVLCVGLHQLSAMRIPPHAAIAATVDAARELRGSAAVGLVNAVLRRYQRERSALESAADSDEEARYMHPHWLIACVRRDWPDEWTRVLEAGNADPPMWLRVNQHRIPRDEYARLVERECALESIASPVAPAALRLGSPRDVHALPGFDEGLVSIQDPAAQLAVPLMGLEDGQRVLDACAAPGGKTSHILETCAGARVTALDIDPERLEQVRENLARLRLEAEVLCADAGAPEAWWRGELFDRILLDAPCTATGVIRRHPDIKLLRRPDDVEALACEQQRLLNALWPLLEPGGRLVYASCSVLREEGAGQIERFLARNADACAVTMAQPWGRACGHGRQVLSGEDAMDGFYYSCVDKLIPSGRA